MKDNIIIRDATENDLNFLIHANNIVNDKSNLERADCDLIQRLKTDFFPNTTHSMAQILIAEIDNEPAGMVVFSACYFMNEGDSIWITNIYTAPQYQRRGVATKLMDAVKEIAQKRNSHIIGFLEDENNIPAQRFVQTNGAKSISSLRYFFIDTDI